jgi:uncharacterized protein (TIGR00369 family)
LIRNDVNAAPIFSQHLPMQVMERGPGRLVLAAAFDEIHLNAAGIVHGGLLSSLLDCCLAGAASAAVGDELGEGGGYGITLSMTVNFVRATGAGEVRCEAQVQGGGNSTKFVEARVLDGGQGPVATASGTVRVIPMPSA